MSALTTNKILFLLLIILPFPLFGQNQKLMVNIGNDQTIHCGDTVRLSPEVSNWIDMGRASEEMYTFYHRVYFTTPSTGFISGNSVLYRTDDGGNTWKTIRFPGDGWLFEIFFVDVNKGYIASNNRLLKTLDGGKNWEIIPLAQTPRSLFFKDVDTGYMAFENTFLKTTDGGRTWAQLSAGYVSTFNRIKFISDKVALASSEFGIYRTQDEGITWVRVSPYTSYDLTGNGAGQYYSCSGEGSIYKSSDNGDTWQKINTGLGGRLKTIAFSSTDSVFVAGESGVFGQSFNGGNTWNRVGMPGTTYFNSIYASEKIKIAVGSYSSIFKWHNLQNLNYKWTLPEGSGEQKKVVVSPRQKSRYKIKASLGQIEGADSVDINIDFNVNLGPDKFINCGDSVQLNGRVTEFIPAKSPSVWDLYYNFFINDSTGFAVGNGIYKTTDYGQNWTTITQSFTPYYTGAFFTSESTGYLSALEGLVMKTTDGGYNWTRVLDGISSTLYGVHFIDKNTGFAYGQNSVIYKTTDGGLTWQLKSTHMLTTLLTMDFVNKDIGYAGGDSCLLLVTHNGGESWQRIQLGYKKDIVSMDFYDEQNGLMVGSKGLILKTTNGGSTWKEIRTSRTATYSTVNYINRNEVLAMGDEIIYSSDGGETWVTLSSSQKKYIYSAFWTKDKLYTVGRDGEMMIYKPYRNISYSWMSTNTPVNSASYKYKTQPLTNTTYFVKAVSNEGCVSGDTIKISIKGLNINAKADKNRITCGDSTFLTFNNWYRIPYTGNNLENVSTVSTDTVFIFDYTLNSTTDGGNTWKKIYGIPNFQSVSFINGKRGFGVTSYNYELQTTNDGGLSWATTNIKNCKQVLFVDKDKGYLIGDTGHLMRSVNGGTSWIKTTVGTSEHLRNIGCYKDILTIKTYQENFFISSDWGITWKKVNQPANEKITAICMISALNGFAASNNGNLYVTTDGGNTWSFRSKSMPSIKSLFFVDQLKGYCLENSYNYKIYETCDGGLNWTEAKGVLPAILDFKFNRTNEVLALGYNGTLYSSKLNQFADIYWYAAGGYVSRQTPFNYVKPAQTTTYFLKAANESACYASDTVVVAFDALKVDAGPDRDISAGDSVQLFASVGNGNGKWNMVSSNFSRVRFVDRNTGFAYSKNYEFLKTEDGGKTWTVLSKQYSISDFVFVDALTGYAAGSYLYKTKDGGKTWSVKYLNQHISKLYFYNKRKGFGIVAGSMYMETNDHGRTWKLNNLGNNYYIYDIFFRNDSCGFITLAYNDFYLKTTNGGKTWEKQPISQRIRTIYFTDSLRAFAGGSSILKSADGGKTWNVKHSVSSSEIMSFKFVNPLVGFAMVKNGKILKTTDGGETWEFDFDTKSDNYYVREFEFPDAGHGFICFEKGTLATYTEPLAVNFTWEPAALFKNPAGTSQKLIAVKSDKIVLKAVSPSGCVGSDTVEIHLKDKSQFNVLQKIDIIETMVELDPGYVKELTVVAYPENASDNDIRFVSTDTTVATVDAYGQVKALNGGQTTIFAKSPDGKIWDNCIVNVTYKLKSIKILPEYSGVEVGGTSKLFIEFNPVQAKNKSFYCSVMDNNFFEIIEKGEDYVVIRGKREGYSTIRVESMEGAYISWATVFVGPRLNSIDILENEKILSEKENAKLNLKYNPTTLPKNFFVWLSSDTSVVAVDSTGTITARKEGETWIGCFYIFNPYKYDTCYVQVYNPRQMFPYRVYPNPCHDFIRVESEKVNEFFTGVTIYDNSGKVFFKEEFHASIKDIWVGNLEKGVYIIELTTESDGKKHRYKFFKL